jgi:hypothetical protein
MDVGWRTKVSRRELVLCDLEMTSGVITADLERGHATTTKCVVLTLARRNVETFISSHRQHLA